MKVKLNEIVKNPKFVPVVGLVSFGVGVGVGYILGKHHRKEFYIPPNVAMRPEDLGTWIEKQQLAFGTSVAEETVTITLDDEESEEEPEKEPEVEEKASKEAIGAKMVEERLKKTIQTHQGTKTEEVRRSIFAETTEEWDYDEELRHRSSAAPYILHKDEFYGEEMAGDGYSQTTLTYYEGDDIMAKQDDTPLYNYESVVGPLKFGHGSDDPNVFYVRNMRRKEEYEIIHDSGLFSVEVMGIELEDNERVKALKTDKFKPSD